MIDEAVLANAERETLVDTRSLIFRLNAFNIDATMNIERIIDELVSALARFRFRQ